ncbi:MAG: twin-arginine translocation signal domain-containing protein [Gemmatimonadetes bacterium]|nr:twin-arginine translocation signal domain-containing protein [Gemmatimonadota bacterium]
MTMPGQSIPLLSDLLEQGLSRRGFLAKTAAAGAVITAGCTRDQPGQETGQPTDSAAGCGSFNANSREDTVLGMDHPTPVMSAERAAPYRRYDPSLPPLSSERTMRLSWRAQELPLRIDHSTVVAAWTFEGDITGPIVHVRQWDTV